MIRSILIANRGEIACRIVRSCRRLGVRTVAVYSDADAAAKHVQLADTAVLIGLSPATDSYLNPTSILNAARQTGVDAIHPGYGFLAENPELPKACEDNGIIFIGPRSETMRQLGDKISARKIAIDCKVPITEGSKELQILKTWKPKPKKSASLF